jgi:NAD(P)-dependent dehydrogenase (short-subunit alcohol dehydrogenase family)
MFNIGIIGFVMHTGKRVLITAAASGIGLAIARGFVAQGAKVHVCDINEDALRSLKQSDPSITSTVCDVSDRSSVERLIIDATNNLGGLDVLVNNAGISGPTAPVETMDPDAWEAVLRVNLTGTFNVTRLSIPYLKQAGSGVIIIMSSLGGRVGYPDRSPYATTKWGLIGLTKTLSIELGEAGIRVNAILPGAVDGPRLQHVFEGRASASGKSIAEVTKEALANQSIKRFVDPGDIAALALFLASDSGRSISGQTIPIDGDSQTAG